MKISYISGFCLFWVAACGTPEQTETPHEAAPESTLSGIDVSHFQGDIDWAIAAATGIDFVYVKASEGLHTDDPHLKINWHSAAQHGLMVGAYHFFHPEEDAAAQAAHFLGQLKAANIHVKGALPPVLDIETSGGIINSAEFRKDVLVWLTTVEDALHCKPILYTNPHFWAKEHPGKFGDYKIWLADYAVEATVPKGWKNWTFWQHTQDGKIPGVATSVDLNAFAGNDTHLKELACK